MMLWFSQRPPDVRSDQIDGFTYYLAHQLGRTVTEVENMPHAEYVRWFGYFTAKAAIENMRPIVTPGSP